MDLAIRIEGADELTEVLSLTAWLADEREFQGRVRTVTRPPGEQELSGGAFDVLTVALGSGGAGVALAYSLSAWLSHRRSDVKLTISANDRSVEVDARRVGDVQGLIQAVNDLLRDGDGR